MADVFMKMADLDTKTDTYMEDTVKIEKAPPTSQGMLGAPRAGRKVVRVSQANTTSTVLPLETKDTVLCYLHSLVCITMT